MTINCRYNRLFPLVYLIIVVFLSLPLVAAHNCPDLDTIRRELGCKLSKDSNITDVRPPRWDDLTGPRPKVVINVAEARDVQHTVAYATQKNLKFATQAGGNGWATTFDLGDCGLLISLAKLNKIEFNDAKTEATIGGGAIISDVIRAAYDNDSRIATPNCPCLGLFGVSLGGGLNRMSGLYGWAVDQIKSMEVVLASGAKITASRTSHKELYWALRGAAPNFGIVTSAVFEAYPMSKQENIGWQGSIIFEDKKLERVVDVLKELHLSPRMQFDIVFLTSGPPSFTPMIQVFPLYLGKENEAREAYKALLDLGPSVDETKVIPYSEFSDWAIPVCAKGGRKPTYGVSSRKLNIKQIRTAYEEFKSLIAKYGSDVGFSSVLFENYPTEKAIERDDGTSSFALRDVPIHVAIVPWSENSTLDGPTTEFASKVRSILRKDNGIRGNETYINFARGDESLRDIYGANLRKLKSYKNHYDPDGRFDQWFNLK